MNFTKYNGLNVIESSNLNNKYKCFNLHNAVKISEIYFFLVYVGRIYDESKSSVH